MKKRTFKRTVSFVLGLVILAQLFCAVPVIAAGDYWCYFIYNDQTSAEFPNMGTIQNTKLIQEVELDKSLADQDIAWPDPPSRIIGKRFLGWYLYNTETPVTHTTTLTQEMVTYPSMPNTIAIEGRWEENTCADITTASLRSYDKLGNTLSSNLTLYDDQGTPVDFSKDVTKYYIKVLNNAVFAEFDFHIYEPAATYTATYNNAEVTTVPTFTTEYSQVHDATFEAGIDVKMQRVTLLEQTDNIIDVQVTAADGETSKTYVFHIERSAAQIKLTYGNTPFGRIAQAYSSSEWTEEDRNGVRAQFSSTYTLPNTTTFYSPKAWREQDSDEEVMGGVSIGEGQYRNYDKDETAIVAYIGASFTDPGFTVYNADGEIVSLSDTHTVKRTINYETVPSYAFSDFNTITPQTLESTLKGEADENVISILKDKDKKVRPGVYTIRYEYQSDIFEERKLIVIPRPGDLNMDGYVNSMDVSVYNYAERPTTDTLGGSLYLYRGMDLTRDGVIDEDDINVLKNRTGSVIEVVYPDISKQETVVQVEYTSPGTSGMAQMSMKYLGKNSGSITETDPATEPLNKDDIFWVGYRLDNVEDVEELKEGVYSLTVAINYDTRYVSPAVVLTEDEAKDLLTENEQWLATLKKYNSIWDGYEYNGFTNSALSYTANNSTALSALESVAETKTLVMDITAEGTPKTLVSGEYILTVPFKVVKVPPEGRQVLDVSLDANTFNMTTGNGGETAIAWDTKNELSNNLADIIDFKGADSLEFVAEEGAKSINEYYNNAGYTYGNPLTVSVKNLVENGTGTGTIEELPDDLGLSYIKGATSLTGTPKRAGTFEFYVNGVKLSITISKAPMEVIAEDKVKMYGDENPPLTLKFNADYIKTSVDTDGLNSAGFLAGLEYPTLTCDAKTTTPVGGTEDIIIEGGSSDNYYFIYVNGTLEVNQQRPITVNQVEIPVCSSEDSYINRESETFYIEASSHNGEGGKLVAEEIIGEDIVKVKYKVKYPSNTVGDSITVYIEDMELDEGYEQSKNYTIGVNNMTMSTEGKVLDKVLDGINVKVEPSYQYTYGQTYSYDEKNTNIILSFDNTQQIANLCVGDMTTYDIQVKAYDKNGNEMDETISEALKLTVPKHNGMVVALVPKQPGLSDLEKRLKSVEVLEKDMDVWADDVERVYGEPNPEEFTFTYDPDDFAYDEGTVNYADFREANLVEPTAQVTATQSSDVGEYPIFLTGGSHDNYKFTRINGTFKITTRPLDIKSIDKGIPALTAKEIAKNPTATEYVLEGTATRSQLTCENAYGTDDFKITYKAVYKSAIAGSYTVDIRDVFIDETYEKGSNYSLRGKPTTAAGGVVHEKNIESYDIVTQPKLEYTYGETLDLKSGEVYIKYDNGDEANVTFDKLSEHNIQLLYAYVSGKIEDEFAEHDDVISVLEYNDNYLILVPASIYNLSRKQTNPFVIHKAPMKISVVNTESVYGNRPEFKYEYNSTDFKNGETANSTNFLSTIIRAPAVECAATGASDIGEYDVILGDAESSNYEFSYAPGTHTIKQRSIEIESIKSGVPPLTSAIIHEEPGSVHRLEGTAVNEDMTVINLVGNDSIKITYTAVYNSITPANPYVVQIENVQLDNTVGKSANYTLSSTPTTSDGGRIDDREIMAVEITEQPKLEYTYGETLDLSGGKVKITYDSGLVEEDLTFAELSEHRITLTYTGTEDTPTHGGILTVPYHNGKTITLTPTTVRTVTAPVTEPIKVEKQVIKVTADSTTSVYGNSATFTFGYDTRDFVNGETPESDAFTDGLTLPVSNCTVDETTEVGEYTVTVSGGEAANYKFEYYTGTHTVTPRPLTVTEITGGVPPLTSDIIYEQAGEVHDIDAWADLTMMEVINAVEGDAIKILYKARYNSVTPVESIDIEVVEAELEEGYGKNRNYTLTSVVSTAEGGRIYDLEIESVEITEQPKLEYTYGETLDLSGGKVKITYDSGLVEEDLTFAELSEHRITLTYTGTEDTPTHGEVLTVPYHNGKTITLTPTTVHTVTAPQTELIKVEKKTLTYGTCVVDSIVYDGSTTLTAGTVVLVGEENGDVPVATGVFNFEDHLAGENKTVYITEIKLDEQTELNYQLAADNTTALGTIEKATPTAQLSAEDVVLSEDNIITITAPAMTQIQQDGGAEYEYTIDGGQTWQKSNVFEELALRQDYAVSIRFAETSNFKQSEATAPIEIKTYFNKITLISYDDMNTLASFFTNVEDVENADELEELIGDVGVTYYLYYVDETGKTEVDFPLTLTGDVVIYTSLKKPEDPKDKGGIVYTLPVAGTSSETKNEPYVNGYAGMIYPDKHMTRAEAVTMMVKVLGDTGLDYDNVFSDVSDDAWYEKFVSQGSARGLISGVGDQLFCPEEPVTREQFATMVARMIELKPLEGESFVDVEPGRWSAGYINAVSEKGIVSGYEDRTFRPENSITRAEAIRMINVATGRIPNKQLIDGLDDCPFVDIPKSHWAYYEIMMAACEY